MDKYAALKEKLKKCEDVTMGNLMVMNSPLLLDAFKDLDCVLVDKEHGIFGNEELVPITSYCRHIGLPTIVRVEDKEYHLIAKAIDFGADGIMLPRVETPEQVKIAIDGMRFLPEGRTGFGGFGILRPGETFEDFQNGRILMIQIESHKGLENIPAMLEAYGDYIDAFIIGPNDYTISEGMPWDIDNPHMLDEFEQIFKICKAHGKSVGCFATSVERMVKYREMGGNVHWFGDDASYIRIGLEHYLREIR